jgi:hypothetical protein
VALQTPPYTCSPGVDPLVGVGVVVAATATLQDRKSLKTSASAKIHIQASTRNPHRNKRPGDRPLPEFNPNNTGSDLRHNSPPPHTNSHRDGWPAEFPHPEPAEFSTTRAQLHRREAAWFPWAFLNHQQVARASRGEAPRCDAIQFNSRPVGGKRIGGWDWDWDWEEPIIPSHTPSTSTTTTTPTSSQFKKACGKHARAPFFPFVLHPPSGEGPRQRRGCVWRDGERERERFALLCFGVSANGPQRLGHINSC